MELQLNCCDTEVLPGLVLLRGQLHATVPGWGTASAAQLQTGFIVRTRERLKDTSDNQIACKGWGWPSSFPACGSMGFISTDQLANGPAMMCGGHLAPQYTVWSCWRQNLQPSSVSWGGHLPLTSTLWGSRCLWAQLERRPSLFRALQEALMALNSLSWKSSTHKDWAVRRQYSSSAQPQPAPWEGRTCADLCPLRTCALIFMLRLQSSHLTVDLPGEDLFPFPAPHSGETEEGADRYGCAQEEAAGSSPHWVALFQSTRYANK